MDEGPDARRNRGWHDDLLAVPVRGPGAVAVDGVTDGRQRPTTGPTRGPTVSPAGGHGAGRRRFLARQLVALARWSLDHPRRVLLFAALLVAAALASALARLELRTSNLDLVSQELPPVAAFRAFASEFGSPNVLVVAFEGRDRETLRRAVDLAAPRLAALPSVRGVLGHLALAGVRRGDGEGGGGTAAVDLGALLGRSSYLESDDGRMAFLLVQPRDAEARAATIAPFVEEVRGVLVAAGLAGQGVAWGLTGLPQYALDDREVISRDASRMAVLSLVLVAGLFVTAYATIWRPLLATVTLIVAAVVTFGLVAWYPGHLTLLSAFAASILFGIGDDFGVHLINLVEAAAGEGRASERDAVLAAVDELAESLSTAGLTTVAAFLALIASGFQGFAELGLIAAVGVACALVAVVTLLPALLVSVRVPRGRGRALGVRDSGRWLAALARPWVAWPVLVLAIAGPLWLGLPHFDGDYLNLEARDSEAVRLEREMVARSDLSPQFAAFVVGSRREVLELAMALRREETVGEVHTIAEIDQLARLLGATEQEAVARSEPPGPADAAGGALSAGLAAELGELAAPFASREGRFAVYAYPRGDIWDPTTRDAFLAAMAAHDRDGSRGLTGMPVLGRFMIDLSLRAMRRASLLAAMVVVLLVALDLRRWQLTLAALLPMVAGGGLLLVAMRWLGLAWNPLDVMALPVVIGYGVDNGVHLVHRFVAERGDLTRTLAGTGRGVLLSTATTLAGFAPLTFTAHQGFASFAQVLALGVAASLVASLLVLPWWLGQLRQALLGPAS
jgi:predicted RND superfamily exporter protein